VLESRFHDLEHAFQPPDDRIVTTRARIATRGSRLALWQANWVAARLETHGLHAELVIFETQGDRESSTLREMDGQGFFTKAIQDAVLDGRADVAVHSLKDLPSTLVPGLVIAAIPVREDPRDVLIARPEAVDVLAPGLPLKLGSSVGTSAARRQAQIQHLRPDLERRELRGNVPTRLEKLQRGEYDAILIAQAGVHRLGLEMNDLGVFVLEPERFVPAPGQGALALECRSDDDLVSLLARVDDPEARVLVDAERGLMARLRGGCQLALGAHARRTAVGLELIAWYEGRFYQAHASSPSAVADRVLEQIRTDHPEAVS
jgi:hydroxymethylbilane synthase